ncbi:hypothetical protein SAY87_023805 [Trapa incisa]|uniref:YTH domain-containing family protein n=1 Tax=Trapa incisa TaxID=236973 RepID=A0AAN7L1U5_9MYRT|nr:hypothetical protein SAY87_023805 [Trapa incisa]
MTGVYSSFPWAHHQSYANCCSCLNGHPDEAVDVGLGQPGVPYEGFYGGNRTSSSTQPRAKNFRRNVPFHRRKGRGGSYGGKRRGKRTNRTNGQLAAKARTTKVGDADLQGVNTINTDQYSKCDFPVEYEVAKFFVIKSYSEDDIHKSIKYSVWSSTPRGNKKLQNAYHDAQRLAAGKPSGCPVFLFFSVNASGRFCGVAEMIGPVDFDISMDFWQQDKWTGSFPVRWHFVIDVHNAAFRHIKLKNNENKPVTKSRDTQEVFYRQGLKMLKIFKKRTWKKSILDDFRYYEDREKMMQEKRAQAKKSPAPHTVDAADPPSELPNIVIEQNTEAANAMESVVTNDNEETQESTSGEEDNGANFCGRRQ